ncbi:hypothetical protein [Streptomyces sp. NBC_00470]|uniref:hypothetical protein n=1 Tax=Streptomyces sp. NBC_00470 TaxID=2975753 RepID=UPI0030E00D47
MRNGDEYGIWGGLRQKDFRVVRRRYREHRKNGGTAATFDFASYLMEPEESEDAA